MLKIEHLTCLRDRRFDRFTGDKLQIYLLQIRADKNPEKMDMVK